jgi:hypothetical protein
MRLSKALKVLGAVAALSFAGLALGVSAHAVATASAAPAHVATQLQAGFSADDPDHTPSAFHIDVSVPGDCKAKKPCSVEIKTTSTNGFCINHPAYKQRFKPDAVDGVKFAVDDKGFTKPEDFKPGPADACTESDGSKHPGVGSIALQVTADAPGKKTITGWNYTGVCSGSNCIGGKMSKQVTFDVVFK